MPYKDVNVRKSKQAQYSRKNYEGNYAKRRKELNDRKKELREQWYEFKRTLKCTKCGFDHFAALDFHHEDPSKKEHNVNQLISDGRFAKAYKEVEKCIVLCANCHRIHHYDEHVAVQQNK